MGGSGFETVVRGPTYAGATRRKVRENIKESEYYKRGGKRAIETGDSGPMEGERPKAGFDRRRIVIVF